MEDQEKIKWLKWRWEFMRRNPEYIKDYKKVKRLRNKANANTNDKNPYFLTPEGRKEKEYCTKWKLSSTQMFDPFKAFEELIEEGPGFFMKKGQSAVDWPVTFVREKLSDPEELERVMRSHNKYLVLEGLDPGAIKILGKQVTSKNGKEKIVINKQEMIGNHLIIDIDFDKVNSLQALKEEICEMLEEHFDIGTEIKVVGAEEIEVEGEKTIGLITKVERKYAQTYLIDYELILLVGDMKEKEGLRNREIAKIIFPQDFKPNNENANEESAIRKVGQYYQRYKELVNGGYEKITIP